jgi:hypothetical protein
MKLAAAGASSFLIGVLAATYCRRYIGALVWWLFTADIRNAS